MWPCRCSGREPLSPYHPPHSSCTHPAYTGEKPGLLDPALSLSRTTLHGRAQTGKPPWARSLSVVAPRLYTGYLDDDLKGSGPHSLPDHDLPGEDDGSSLHNDMGVGAGWRGEHFEAMPDEDAGTSDTYCQREPYPLTAAASSLHGLRHPHRDHTATPRPAKARARPSVTVASVRPSSAGATGNADGSHLYPPERHPTTKGRRRPRPRPHGDDTNGMAASLRRPASPSLKRGGALSNPQHFLSFLF